VAPFGGNARRIGADYGAAYAARQCTGAHLSLTDQAVDSVWVLIANRHVGTVVSSPGRMLGCSNGEHGRVMSRIIQERNIVRFGVYDVDLSAQVLRKRGIRIKLQPKPFQVLQTLLENEGNVTSREELKKLLWAPETFVDFDHGLNTAVNKIREALNDTADNPRFIETLPNGYRFIAAVDGRPVPREIEHSVPPKQVPDLSRIHRWRLGQGAIAGAVVCLVVASLLVFLYRNSIFKRPPSSIRSIAVLPLRNLSGDPAQDYFTDSMSDELITQIAQISSLQVASAASVLPYKNTNIRVLDLGRDLKVDAFVEGSVLRSGDRVRISAQLIDARTNRHIWAEDYQGDMRDVLVLQSDIASAIAAKIQARITPFERSRLSQAHQVDPRAYDAYIKGRGYWSRGKTFGARADDLEKSGEAFRLALQYDPNYAPAYSGLANYYGYMAGDGDIPAAEGWRLSEDASRKALALDQTSAEAHCALATKMIFYDWDWAGAEREIRHAMESDPRYAELHNVYSHLLAYTGRFDESIAEAHRAEDLDPLGQRTAVQRALRFSRRFDLFLPEVEKTFSEDPARIHQERAMVYKARKEFAREVEETDQQLRLEGCPTCADRLARAYAAGGYQGWLRARLSDLGKRSELGRVSPFEFAEIYTAMGNKDMAMQYLEIGYRERTADLVRLQVNPAYDDLRSDPRFQNLVRRIGLPQQAAQWPVPRS
jgi:TolB-like protein/DNA-binding winged helix-turn-helix (wHTH) protein